MAKFFVTWSEELLAQVCQLRGEGCTIAEIGRRMGRTKGQIIGVLHRAGLLKGSKWNPSPREELWDPFPPPGHCLFSYGEPQDHKSFHFCGAPAVLDRCGQRSWCREHTRIVYVPARKREEDHEAIVTGRLSNDRPYPGR